MLENKNTSKTELSDLGEFALIDYLTKTIKPKPHQKKSKFFYLPYCNFS